MENLETPDLGFTSMEPIQGFSSDLDCHQSESRSQNSSIVMPSFLTGHRTAGLGISDSAEFGVNDALDLHDFAITSSGVGLGSHIGMSTLHSELSMFGLPSSSSVSFPTGPVPGHSDLMMPQSMSMATGGRMPVYSFLPRNNFPSFTSSEPCSSVSLSPHPHPSFSFHSFPVPGSFGDGFSMPATCPPGLSFRSLPNIETMVIGSNPSRTCSLSSAHLSSCPPPPQVVPISGFVPPMPKYIPPSPVPISSPNLTPRTPSATAQKKNQEDVVCAETCDVKTEKSLSDPPCSSSVAVGLAAISDSSNVFSSGTQRPLGIPVVHDTSQNAAPTNPVHLVIGHTNYLSAASSNERLPLVSCVNTDSEKRREQESEKVDLNNRLNNATFLSNQPEPVQCAREVSGSALQSRKADEILNCGGKKASEFLATECESVTKSETEEHDLAAARNPLSPQDIKGEASLSNTILSNLKMEDRLQLESAGFLGYELGDAELSPAAAGFVEKVDINVHVDESQCVIIDGHKRWKCLQCPKMYSTKHNLITHILGHRGIKPHYCSICGKFFKQVEFLS